MVLNFEELENFKMKAKSRTLGLKSEFIIYDFKKPIKKESYNGTDYVYYEGMFLKRIKVEEPEKLIAMPKDKYYIMIPFPLAWYQLKEKLKEYNCLNKKNIRINAVKKNNWSWIYTLISYTTNKGIDIDIETRDSSSDRDSSSGRGSKI